MLNYQDCRNDKGFMIDSLTYEEIFKYFEDVVNEIKKQNHDGVFEFWPVELRKERCECVRAYGADKDLYPKIKLDMCNYVIVLTPFEVKLLLLENGLKEIKSEELDNVLIKMMCGKFPEANYLEKRDKYFQDAEFMKRTQFGWDL